MITTIDFYIGRVYTAYLTPERTLVRRRKRLQIADVGTAHALSDVVKVEC